MHLVDARGAGKAERYLLEDEQLVVVVHQHWARLVEAVACTVVGFVLVIVIGLVAPASAGALSNAAWWIWFALLAYALAAFWQWRREWFVATDRRLLLTYGILTHQVAMMPMQKVTDMSFNRSPLGLLAGYGTFVLESAGQEQAMHRIRFIPHPDETYRAICEQIFGDPWHQPRPGDIRPDDADADGRAGDTDERVYAAGVPAAAPPDPTDIPVRRYGAYLPKPEPKRSSRLRHRILRRPRPAGDKPLRYYEWDQAWTVSNEDASNPQQVPPQAGGAPTHRYRRRDDDGT